MTTELLRPVTSSRALELYPFQTEAIESLRVAARSGNRRIILCAPTGSGKCLGEGTLILMADGTETPVELVGEGDCLMGPDSTPRRVQSITQGVGPMYRINPVKGDPWECNGDHILMLVRTGELDDPVHRKRDRDGEIVKVTVNEWLTWSKWRKHVHKLYRVPVEFPAQNLPVHPYLLGILLGDGSLTNNRIVLTSVDSEIVEAVSWLALQHGVTCKETPSEGRAQGYLLSNDRGQGNPLLESLRDLGIQECRSGEKFIPAQYRTASREQRLQLLAGLLDTDGHLSDGYFDFVVKSRELAEGTAYVARSLGLAAYISLKQQLYRGEIRDYWRVTVSGEVSEIPTRISRKRATPRQQKKDVLRTGFSVESLGDDDYYGFTLNGDGEFLLGDFTVTHNTEMAIHLIQEAQRKGSLRRPGEPGRPCGLILPELYSCINMFALS